jgi:hypothetical protein
MRRPDPPLDRGLGYRGLSVLLDDNDKEEVRLKGGVVSFRGQMLDDPDRSIERWLIEQAPANVFDSKPDF